MRIAAATVQEYGEGPEWGPLQGWLLLVAGDLGGRLEDVPAHRGVDARQAARESGRRRAGTGAEIVVPEITGCVRGLTRRDRSGIAVDRRGRRDRCRLAGGEHE